MPLLNNSTYNRRVKNQVVLSSGTKTVTVNLAHTTSFTVNLTGGQTGPQVLYLKARVYNRGTYNGVRAQTGTVVTPVYVGPKSVGQLYNSKVYNGYPSVYVPPDTRSYLNGGYNSDPYQQNSYNDALNVIIYHLISMLGIVHATNFVISLNLLRPHYATYDIKFIMPAPYSIKMVVDN